MKKLYLHVGFGKTGSSALQSWLANKSELLFDQGYHYKVIDKNSINYRVSSGNGAYLRQFLNSEINSEQLFDWYFSSESKNVIISSETLEMDLEKINRLKSFVDEYDIELHVIAYVRNAYDCFYSTYVQGVKRSGLVANINEMISRINPMRHVEAGFLYRNNVENISFIHYDKHKSDVAYPFCQILNIDYDEVGKIDPVRVNRTLNNEEIEVVKFFVRSLKSESEDDAGDISRLISDYLVNSYKGIKSEVFVYEDILSLFKLKYSKELISFNEEIGSKFNLKLEFVDESDTRLVYLNSSNSDEETSLNKNIVKDISKLVIDNSALFDNSQLAKLALDLNSSFPGISRELISNITNTSLNADVLRDSAIALEEFNIGFSKYLMGLAAIARPNGSFIKMKLREYRNQNVD